MSAEDVKIWRVNTGQTKSHTVVRVCAGQIALS